MNAVGLFYKGYHMSNSNLPFTSNTFVASFGSPPPGVPILPLPLAVDESEIINIELIGAGKLILSKGVLVGQEVTLNFVGRPASNGFDQNGNSVGPLIQPEATLIGPRGFAVGGAQSPELRIAFSKTYVSTPAPGDTPVATDSFPVEATVFLKWTGYMWAVIGGVGYSYTWGNAPTTPSVPK